MQAQLIFVKEAVTQGGVYFVSRKQRGCRYQSVLVTKPNGSKEVVGQITTDGEFIPEPLGPISFDSRQFKYSVNASGAYTPLNGFVAEELPEGWTQYDIQQLRMTKGK